MRLCLIEVWRNKIIKKKKKKKMDLRKEKEKPRLEKPRRFSLFHSLWSESPYFESDFRVILSLLRCMEL